MLTRTQKEEQVAHLRERFDRATGVIVADYRGIGVQEINQLRCKLRDGDDEYEYRVSKNTLLRRAVEGSQAAVLLDQFEGPTAVALSFGDPIALAKILVDFAKEHEVFEIRAGLLDDRPRGDRHARQPAVAGRAAEPADRPDPGPRPEDRVRAVGAGRSARPGGGSPPRAARGVRGRLGALPLFR
jgi:ribosomal protein L10